MRSIEFFKNIPVGQYIDNDTFLHRLSPAVKIVWMLMILILITSIKSLVIISLLLLFCLALALYAGIKLSFIFRGIRPILGILVFILFLQVLFYKPLPQDMVLFTLGRLTVTKPLALAVAGILIRFLSFMVTVTLFTSITTEADTVSGTEFLLQPFSKISPWIHAFALTMNITFRFVPILVGELELIVKAQVSRGSSFGEKRFIVDPLKAVKDYLPLVVPVIFRSLDKAVLLGDAMDARCYRSHGRTRYRALRHSVIENLLLILGLVVPVGILVFSIVWKLP